MIGVQKLYGIRWKLSAVIWDDLQKVSEQNVSERNVSLRNVSEQKVSEQNISVTIGIGNRTYRL